MSFLKFDIDAENSIHLNVTNVARIYDNSNANSMTVEYSYVGAGQNRTLPIGFTSAVTLDQIANMQALAFKANKSAGSIADTKSIMGTNYLSTLSTPK